MSFFVTSYHASTKRYLSYPFIDCSENNFLKHRIVSDFNLSNDYCRSIDCLVKTCKLMEMVANDKATHDYWFVFEYNKEHKTNFKEILFRYVLYTVHDFGVEEIRKIKYSFRNKNGQLALNLSYEADITYDYDDSFHLLRLDTDDSFELFVEEIKYSHADAPLKINSFLTKADNRIIKLDKEIETFRKKHTSDDYKIAKYEKYKKFQLLNKLEFNSYGNGHDEPLFDGHYLYKNTATFKRKINPSFAKALSVFEQSKIALKGNKSCFDSLRNKKILFTLKPRSYPDFFTSETFFAFLPLLEHKNIKTAYLDEKGELNISFEIEPDDSQTLLILYMLCDAKKDYYGAFVENGGYIDTSLLRLDTKIEEAFFQNLDSLKCGQFHWVYDDVFDLARNVFAGLIQKNKNYDRKNYWQSEYYVFLLIKMVLHSAVYQFHPKFLGQLSLDIFVPEKNIAFEYQGEGHFFPISHFGGEKTLEDQKKRDQLKQKICKTEGITLKYISFFDLLKLDHDIDFYSFLNNRFDLHIPMEKFYKHQNLLDEYQISFAELFRKKKKMIML